MITFIAPFALAALALLAIPIILHLFKPRKVRRTPFSSLRWLHLAQQKLARRIRWHQLLLFVLRAGFIACLALAAAKPLYNRHGAAGPIERIVVLDTSRSMRYRMPDGQTPLAQAKAAAGDILRQGSAGDRCALVPAGATPQSVPLSHDPAAALAALATAQAGAADAELGASLQSIHAMLAERRADAQVEIDFVTDNQQSSWRAATIAAFLKDLPAPPRVRVIDVGVAGAQNAWVGDVRWTSAPGAIAKRTLRVQVGCVGDAGQTRVVHIAGFPGVPEASRPVKIEPGVLTAVDFELPPGATERRGTAARVWITPADALPDDDEFFLNLDPPPPTRVLIVEPDDTQIPSMRPGFYLRAALSALAAADNRTIDVRTRTPTAVSPADVDIADAIFFTDVPRVSEAALAALESRMKAGAGLAIFLGPRIEPQFYNTQLFHPLLPSESLLAAPLGAVAKPKGRQLEPLSRADWSHPLLTDLNDPILGDLPQTIFTACYEMGPLPRAANVVAWVGERSPAIIERPLGAGRVVVFNTTANDAWSDLPRRKSFVPLLDRLLLQLTGTKGARSSFEAGEKISLPLPAMKGDDTISVIAPGGAILTPVVRTQRNSKVLELPQINEPGVYRVHASSQSAPIQTFVVQAGRRDSIVTPMDSVILRKWWEPAEVEIVTADSLQKSGDATPRRVALWPWLVAGGCLFFLAEMFLVHWLCPRMNPSIIAPVVPRRGMLSRRLETREAIS